LCLNVFNIRDINQSLFYQIMQVGVSITSKKRIHTIRDILALFCYICY